MKNIAILASGSGSNAQNIAEYFKGNEQVSINAILTNKKDAFVLERAEKLNVPSYIFNRNSFYNTDEVLDILNDKKTDLIVLAGFLWLIPENILKKYNKRIINIHPALLPKYGGKGMYGMNVHNAVKENGDEETGITIHVVNDKYDEGDVVFQAKCEVVSEDTPDTIAEKVHKLEYEHFPKQIELYLESL
jgi:phosphoribosylglycinamide formyltransferase-1